MSDKPFPPSLKKLRDARKKGEIPKSQQVNSTAVFAVVLLVVTLSLPSTLKRLQGLFDAVDAMFRDGLREDLWLQLYERSLGMLLWTVLPVLGAAMLAAVVAGWFQTKGLLSMKPLEPKFERLNPASNIKRIVSVKQMLDLAKKLLETTVLAGLIAWMIWHALGGLLLAVYQPPLDTAASGSRLIAGLFSAAAIFWVAVSALDYGIQYFTFMREQRMSFEEVKREYKEMEGDPLIKGQRRSLHMEMAMSAEPRSAKGARALIANPTHVSVAIAFEPKAGRPPSVHAKALDGDALRLRREAEQLGIPVFEDVLLARRLYGRLDVGEAITPEFYAPIARVLVWVEQLGLERAADSA